MKPYTSLLLMTMIVVGCAPTIQLPTKIDRVEYITVLDFRPFSQKGFLFTPDGYEAGKYESIGMVDFVVTEGAIWEVTEEKIGRYAGSDLVKRFGRWDYEGTDMQKVVEVIYDRCDEMGANALINFRISRTITEKGVPERKAFVTTHRIQGLAIKRE